MRELLYVSARIEPLSGWSPAELAEQVGRLDGLVHPEDRQRLAEGRDLIRGSWTVEYRLIRRDGGCRWVRESARVLEEGDDSYVVGTLNDITALRDLAVRSRDLEPVLTALMARGRGPMALLEADGRIALANEPFAALLGLDPAALTGTAIGSLAPDDDGLAGALAEVVQAGAAPLRRTLHLRHRAAEAVVEAAFSAVAPLGVDPGCCCWWISPDPRCRRAGPRG